MPVRTVISPLEASIVNQVKSYLKTRSDELAEKGSSDADEGTDMLTDAIILGINEAFKSPQVKALFAAIIDTPAPSGAIPIGATAYNSIMTPATSPTMPNPLSN